MSLFSFGVGGDIWSNTGFTFISPINDILDKDTFTLEEILAEDEVLQEVKSLNIKLVEFLSKGSSVREMMAYLAEPPPKDAQDNRVFKFPYMSCEIICCEVADILTAVANDTDTGPLKKLFSMLDQEGDIDAHRAGYLEKILTVLLKHKCGPMTSFVNAGGLDLFRKMVRHLGNFSIMQVAKLLLLPKYAAFQDIDATALMGDGRGIDGSEGSMSLSTWCRWSDDPGILDTLLGEFHGEGRREFDAPAVAEGGSGGEDDGERSDVHMHLSELLLALIAQFSPESQFLKRMFSKEAIDPLVAAATLTKEQGRQATGSQAALQILAALGDRLVRPLPRPQPPIMNGSEMQVDFDLEAGGGLARHQEEGVGNEFIKVDGNILERSLRELIPSLCAYLRGHTEDPAMITAQTRQQQPRMGSLRLQVVRFLETLVGMDNALLDEVLMQENAMATCLEMMFTYETSSMLHTSVAASVLAILIPATSAPSTAGTAAAAVAGQGQQGGEKRQEEEEEKAASVGKGEGGSGIDGDTSKSSHREVFQRHLFEDCRLIERILEAVALNEDAEKGQDGARQLELHQHRAAVGEATAAAEAAPFASTSGPVPRGEVSSAGDQSGGQDQAQVVMGAVAVAIAGGEGAAGEGGAARRRRRPGRRLGHMGHVLLLSKAIVDAESMAEAGGAQGREGRSAGAASGDCDKREGSAAIGSAVGAEGVGREESTSVVAAAASSSGKSLVGLLVSSRECAEQWQEFVATALVEELGKQLKPLGGFSVPSRDDNQLSSDFPDEAVDMDDTSGLLETITRLQTDSAGNVEGDSSSHRSIGDSPVFATHGAGAGAMNSSGGDLDPDDDDEDYDFEGANASGGNSSFSMMFTSSPGQAWGSQRAEGGSRPSASNAEGRTRVEAGGGGASDGVGGGGMFVGGNASTDQDWANFADFGHAQQAEGAANDSSSSGQVGSSGGGSGGNFASFEPVFALDAPSTPTGGAMLDGRTGGLRGIDPGSAPNVFAPSPPPNWAPRPNSGDAAASAASGEAGKGGDSGTLNVSEKGKGKIGGNGEAGSTGQATGGGGEAGEGFVDFSQFQAFADFSAMMDDAVPSSVPVVVVGAGAAEEDDRMDDDTEEDGVRGSVEVVTGVGVEVDDLAGLVSSSSVYRPERRDSVDAMVGSDDDEKEVELEKEDGQEEGDKSVEALP